MKIKIYTLKIFSKYIFKIWYLNNFLNTFYLCMIFIITNIYLLISLVYESLLSFDIFRSCVV